MTFDATTLGRFRAAGGALAALPVDVDAYRALDESDFLAINDECAAMERFLLLAGRLPSLLYAVLRSAAA